MSRLAEAQTAFQRQLLSGEPAVVDRIVGDQRAPATERIDVYYQAYRLRLIDVLRTDFAGLAALLDDDFEAMASAYIDAHPSVHPSVRWFGRQLSEFLGEVEPWQARPELAEMASFEWNWGLAFDAADASLAEQAELAAMPPAGWAGLRIGFHPSVRSLRLHWNVPAVFAAVARDEAPPALAVAEPAVDWLLWRRDLTVRWRSMQADEAWALNSAAAGRTFADLCEGLCEWHDPDAVPMQAASLLKTWIGEGLVSRLE